MKYWKVKPGTPEHEKFQRYWNQTDGYTKHQAEIEDLIACPMDDNLGQVNYRLYLTEVPEQHRDQFSKNPDAQGFYAARKNSKINKRWIEFCKEKGIDYYPKTRLFWGIGLINGLKGSMSDIDGDYYIEDTDGKLSAEKYQWVEEVPAPAYLRLKADWLERKEAKTA